MKRFANFADAAWVPRYDVQQQSHLWQVMRRLNASDVEELHALAVQNPEQYYATLIEHLDLRFSEPYKSLVDIGKGPQFPKWFPGGRLNIVDSCLRERAEDNDFPAIVALSEKQGDSVTLTYADLRLEVQKLANHLADIGIRRGDCVGLFMPMTVEATIAFFACAWIGAVVVPAFSGYGPEALVTRLQDSAARLLITASGFQRRGNWVDMRSVAIAAAADLPALERVICVGGAAEKNQSSVVKWESWSEAIAAGVVAKTVAPVQMEPNDPLLLVYTSGTTGRPKGIVHSHAGFLLKAVSDYAITFNVQRGDRFCWITDLGWIVGPQMMVANAAIGSTAIYYVGAIDVPDWEQIWRICARERVNIMGISPTAVRSMAAISPEGPAGKHDLTSLHTFVSTGEPWDATSWRWLFERVGHSERPILNYSGGTEIGGGILSSYAALPVKDCSFTGPIIGMDADIVFAESEPGADAIGELVVRNGWPGMTHSFWGNDDERYLDTYWSARPGLWVHGDLAQRDAEGWWFIRGRSDDTLKVAGRRVGPAEIENVLLQSEAVLEAAVVGIPDELKGQSVVAFVVVTGAAAISDEALKANVRARLGSSLVPAKIIFVKSLPKTRNGKVVRRAIVARYLGKPTGDLSTLDNVDSLLEIPQVQY